MTNEKSDPPAAAGRPLDLAGSQQKEDLDPRVESLKAGDGGQDLSRRENEGAVSDAERTEHDEHQALMTLVMGALKQTIDAHGPITPQWTMSAAKRVVKQFLAARAARPAAYGYPDPPEVDYTDEEVATLKADFEQMKRAYALKLAASRPGEPWQPEWQSIESAPKDGSAILTMVANRIPFVAWWSGGDEYGGWWRGDAGYLIYPSHWVALPAPPKDADQ